MYNVSIPSWSVDISNVAGDVFTSPIVDKNIVYIGSGKHIYAIGDTGKTSYYRWASEKFSIPLDAGATKYGEIYSACSVDSSGNFLYFGTTKGYIYKINAITGENMTGSPFKIAVLLNTSANEYIIYAPICIVYDISNNRNVAICSATYDNHAKGVIVALDTSNNSLLWQRENEYEYIDNNGTTTSIINGILFNGIAYNRFKNSVYISTIRHIISLDVSGGAIRCTFKGDDVNKPPVCFSTPTVDSSGNVLVSALTNSNPTATLHNKLYSLTETDIVNGGTIFTKNWEVNVDETERLSAAVIDISGNIWLTAKNKIHKLEFTN